MPSKPKQFRPYEHVRTYQPRADTRPSSAARGYDSDWVRLRNWYIAKHPLCEWPGCRQPARDVDHIIPVSVDSSKRLDAGNLQSLCRSHHRVKTERDKKT